MTVNALTRTALFIALVTAATMAVRIPNPATQGYINLGDAVIFTVALSFGYRAGGLAGGIGSALADLLGGYAIWAPWTLVIKGVEGALVGLLSGQNRYKGWIRGGAMAIAVLAGGAWMATAYYLAGGIMFGPVAALTEVPGNIAQAVTGMIVAFPLSAAVRRIQMRGAYGSDPLR